MTVSNRRGWIMIMTGVLKMDKADIDYIIEKLDSYKPDNIYDGCNSVREKQDQRVCEVLDSLKTEFESDYENGYTPMPKELIVSLSQTQLKNIKRCVDERVEKFGKELIYNWIKCSDKLPENGEPVIVAVYGSDILMVNDNSIESLKKAIEKSRKTVRYTTLAYYINGDGWYSDGFPMMVMPEYWMLLPEPPEEEEK